jgi:hypothetical protein
MTAIASATIYIDRSGEDIEMMLLQCMMYSKEVEMTNGLTQGIRRRFNYTRDTFVGT